MSRRDSERRRHGRVDASRPIVLQIELHGYDSSQARFEASGRTVNLSRGGFLARIDRHIEQGVRCLVHFPGSLGRVGRTMIYGHVSRTVRIGRRYEVAVRFDTPLVEVDL